MGITGEQKINWNKNSDKSKQVTPKEKQMHIVKTDNTEAINKLKNEMIKNLESMIESSGKLYDLEPTTTLSSISITLSLVQRELNKLK